MLRWLRFTKEEVTAYIVSRQREIENTEEGEQETAMSSDAVEARLGFEVAKYFDGKSGLTLRDGIRNSISMQSNFMFEGKNIVIWLNE